jgi:hypothetical protein
VTVDGWFPEARWSCGFKSRQQPPHGPTIDSTTIMTMANAMKALKAENQHQKAKSSIASHHFVFLLKMV